MRRVLVVDDEEGLRRVVCRSLIRSGFEAEAVESAAAAVAVLAERSFYAVVTDYDMPGLNGVELAKLVRTAHPGVLVIGVSSEDVRDAFLSAGAKAFLLKPFDHTDLLAALG